MRLSELMARSPKELPAGDIEITGLASDSRDVQPGYLFAALAGGCAQGVDFIPEALARGAAAVLAPEGTEPTIAGADIGLVTDRNPRRKLALIASRFHGPAPRVVACVTGTNGKSSVAEFTRQIWQAAGRRAATLGTLGISTGGEIRPLRHTTPDPITLHRVLAGLVGDGVDHVALEASSHGLDQHRLDGVCAAAAAFTNLSRDHMDYHPDRASYLASKAALFERVLVPGGTAVLNADDPAVAGLAEGCRARGQSVLTFGWEGADIRLLMRRDSAAGQEATVALAGDSRRIVLPLPGAFQLHNALAAAGLALATGVTEEAVAAALGRLRGVRGRLEEVGRHPAGAPVFVDYAHTPDALASALRAVRPLSPGRLVLVFGCGGERDTGKRREMGEVASRLADAMFVTDDNPRGENPAAIRRTILAACPGAREIGDRGEAIRIALRGLDAGDLLLIAGKGHEQGQQVGDRSIPFDDAAVAREALAALPQSGGSGP